MQEGQLIMFADAMSYGEGCQNQQSGVDTIVNGELISSYDAEMSGRKERQYQRGNATVPSGQWTQA